MKKRLSKVQSPHSLLEVLGIIQSRSLFIEFNNVLLLKSPIWHPFSRRNICRTTGVGAYAGHVARPKYYENLSWGPHYTETICHPLGIHLKPFMDVSGHKTAQKLSKIEKNGWQNFNDGGIYFFFCRLPGIFLLIFFQDPSWGTPLGCPWWL